MAEPAHGPSYYELKRDYEELQIAAACVANAIAIGIGGNIRGTLMETDLRKALKLAPGVLVDIPKPKTRP